MTWVQQVRVSTAAVEFLHKDNAHRAHPQMSWSHFVSKYILGESNTLRTIEFHKPMQHSHSDRAAIENQAPEPSPLMRGQSAFELFRYAVMRRDAELGVRHNPASEAFWTYARHEWESLPDPEKQRFGVQSSCSFAVARVNRAERRTHAAPAAPVLPLSAVAQGDPALTGVALVAHKSTAGVTTILPTSRFSALSGEVAASTEQLDEADRELHTLAQEINASGCSRKLIARSFKKQVSGMCQGVALPRRTPCFSSCSTLCRHLSPRHVVQLRDRIVKGLLCTVKAWKHTSERVQDVLFACRVLPQSSICVFAVGMFVGHSGARVATAGFVEYVLCDRHMSFPVDGAGALLEPRLVDAVHIHRDSMPEIFLRHQTGRLHCFSEVELADRLVASQPDIQAIELQRLHWKLFEDANDIAKMETQGFVKPVPDWTSGENVSHEDDTVDYVGDILGDVIEDMTPEDAGNTATPGWLEKELEALLEVGGEDVGSLRNLLCEVQEEVGIASERDEDSDGDPDRIDEPNEQREHDGAIGAVDDLSLPVRERRRRACRYETMDTERLEVLLNVRINSLSHVFDVRPDGEVKIGQVRAIQGHLFMGHCSQHADRKCKLLLKAHAPIRKESDMFIIKWLVAGTACTYDEHFDMCSALRRRYNMPEASKSSR